MALTDLPALNDELSRAFRIRTQLPPLDLVPSIVPVVQVNPVQVSLESGPTTPPYLRSQTIYLQTNDVQAANFVRATVGAIQAGVYDCHAHFTGFFVGAPNANQRMQVIRLQTIPSTILIVQEWLISLIGVNGFVDPAPIDFSITVTSEETVFMRLPIATVLGDIIRASLWVRPRS